MPKEKTLYFCRECGTETTKWAGQCPGCRAWNTLVEAPAGQAAKLKSKAVSESRKKAAAQAVTKKQPVTISDVENVSDARQSVGMAEFDRVLGGGIVPGSLILLGGDPGIGKSTLLLQTCRMLSGAGVRTLYVSGEESEKQIKLRAERIGEFTDGMLLYSETAMSDIIEAVDMVNPDVLIVDSIQTVYEESVDAAPGSVSQVREVTGILLQLAKSRNITIFIVGHVTKEGNVAGPRMLEHMVDVVLYFEGDKTAMYRMLRGVKNRFGSTNEVGVFEMREQGLIEVPNPSEYLMQGRLEGEAGSVIVSAMEGSRAFLIEVQALVCHSSFPVPRRTAVGTDYNRVNLLMAVLEKRIGMQIGDCDAYVNVAGGMRIAEPALDLAIIASLISSHTGKPFDPKTVFFGEIGLVGEVRAVSHSERRIMEAVKAGYNTIVLPESNRAALDRSGMFDSAGAKLIGVRHVRELGSLT
ncbi:MAG: DNA repair protein RadA [Eubacterium sp.]|nr:DNA repair protein RadA [Eubacterium sp.]